MPRTVSDDLENSHLVRLSKMPAFICKWCCSCLVCVTRQAGRVVQLPLTPILIYGPFHQVGVDIIQFSKSHTGNQYGVVFVDY